MTQPVLYRAHPTKRLLDAIVAVPVDVLVDQREPLPTGVLIPPLGIDGLDLHPAAEGFFGRIKQKFFHKRSFAGVSMDGFINMLDDYMVWYRDKRIKTEFGMSIMDRRRRLGLVA